MSSPKLNFLTLHLESKLVNSEAINIYLVIYFLMKFILIIFSLKLFCKIISLIIKWFGEELTFVVK